MKARSGSWEIRPPLRLRGARAAALAALVVAALPWGCARNPVSGRAQMMLITDDQEFAIGEGADAQIRREYGVYLESPALRSYVERVGSALAARGERPGLVFHFEILDSPIINAFALPGGFVYVTRGMLEWLSSEDELAMVLGHEIGHVTARHGAARISTLYAAQYGSLVGAIISPRTFYNYNDLIGLAMQVALSKYSREQESQADELGVAYAVACGYNPDAGIRVMEILQWLQGREPGVVERWFLSHPPAGERIEGIRARVAALQRTDPDVASAPFARDAYLDRIDGLLVGLFNGSEMVLRDRYYNMDLGVSLGVPAGWDVDLDPRDSLVTMRRAEREYLILEARPLHHPIDALAVEEEFEKTLRRRGWSRTGGRVTRTEQGVGIRFATYQGRTSRKDEIGILTAFLVDGGYRWVLTTVADRDTFSGRRAAYEAEALGISFLDDAQAAALSAPRLQVRRTGERETWVTMAGAYLLDPDAAERLAFYNGGDPDAPPRAGWPVKIPPSLAVSP